MSDEFKKNWKLSSKYLIINKKNDNYILYMILNVLYILYLINC